MAKRMIEYETPDPRHKSQNYVPKAIADKVDYENTKEIMDKLAIKNRLTKGQQEYLDTLTQLIEAYDEKNYPMESDATPL